MTTPERPPCSRCGERPRYQNRSICLECLTAERRERYAKDPEYRKRSLAYHKDYRTGDAYADQRERRRERRASDPEVMAQRRERVNREARSIWLEILAAYGGKCACC